MSNQYSSLYRDYTQQVPPESRVPSKAKRSGLPRLTTKFSSQTCPTADFLSIRSPLSNFQSLNVKRSFSYKDKSPDVSTDVPFQESPWTRNPPNADDTDVTTRNWSAMATDATSPFSRQLAKITRGSNEDIWSTCRPMLPVPRPAWPADGSHHQGGSEVRSLTKECVGKKVLIGSKEVGTLRYFGRTAFASGMWCGIELDKALGKNDGSVDGVIYFNCPLEYGIFAPEDKISLLSQSPEMPAKRLKYENQRPEPSFRLSTASTSSNSSSNSAMSLESQKRNSSGASSATYTICGRGEDSFPGTPEDLKPVVRLKRIHCSQEDGSSDALSPSEATYEDSSLGILSPDQMADFTSGSFGRTPSDENIAALNNEIYEEEGAVGDTVTRWDSEESMPPLNEDLFQSDISAILNELQRHDVAASPIVPMERQHCGSPLQEVPDAKTLPTQTNRTKKLSFIIEPATSEPKHIQSSQKSRQPDASLQGWEEPVENMTTSAVSLDQGYQGDGEFDAPSEAGSVTASSPTERSFKGDIDRFPVYPTTSSLLTETDVSLADDEGELEVNFMAGDRRARIIDGKLYHNHKEFIGLKHFDGKAHESHSSEMDSSGFYSDLDPRDEDSRLEISVLRPLEESRTEMDFNDSVIDDVTRCDEDVNELDSDGAKSEVWVPEEPGANTVPIDGRVEEVPDGDEPVSDAASSQPISPTTHSTEMQPEDTVTMQSIQEESTNDATQTLTKEVPSKPRQYEKPWKSKPVPLKRVDKPKVSLPPPPAMPKKNVQSKLKIMLESSEPSSEDRRQRQQKKGRWDDVMKGIEESKKEDSLRPKVKQVKSRLLENLKTPQPPSPQVEKMRQERRERRERRERQTTVRRVSDRKRSTASNRTSRAPSVESLCGVPSASLINSEASTPDISQRSASSIDKLRHENATAPQKITAVKPKNLRTQKLQKTADAVKVAKPSLSNGQQLRAPAHQVSIEQRKKHQAQLAATNNELQEARSHAHRAQAGVQALTVLIHHLTTQYEPFSTPQYKHKIEALALQLTNVRLCLDENKASVQRLEDEASQRCQLHTEEVLLLQEKITQEAHTLKQDYAQEIQNITESHENELRTFTADQQSQLSATIETHKTALEKADCEWRQQLDLQHERHLQALKQLNTCHKNQLEETENRWKLDYGCLEEVNSKLKVDNKDLKARAKTLEQTLLSDKDCKLQAAKRVCNGLQSDVDSLTTVLEMRNAEIHNYRDQVKDRDVITENLDVSRERVRSLEAKTEDLKAQMDTKSKTERQHLAEHGNLVEAYHREVSINQRLTLDNEELEWKLRQKGDFSRSLPNTTPDSAYRAARHPDARHTEPRRLFSSAQRMNIHGSAPRKARPSTVHETAGTDSEYSLESPPLSPCVKAVIEKSNSVSFILDLNDTFNDDDLGDICISPVHRARRRKNNLEKSVSTSYILGRNKNKYNANGTRTPYTSTPRPKTLKLNGSTTKDADRQTEAVPSRPDSTSESSDEIDRVSDVSWTDVPASQDTKPSFLQHAQEDEYEECENGDFVQVLNLTQGLNSESLSAILGHTPTTSVSLSDSDASQCGSRLELSTDDEATEMDPWVPQDGAGEAMVPRCGQHTNKLASSVVSSDSEENQPKDTNGIWSDEPSCELTSSSELHDLL